MVSPVITSVGFIKYVLYNVKMGITEIHRKQQSNNDWCLYVIIIPIHNQPFNKDDPKRLDLISVFTIFLIYWYLSTTTHTNIYI